LSRIQGQPRTLEMVEPKQAFMHMIPLVEVLAAATGVKNPASKKVVALYEELLKVIGNETAFWAMPEEDALQAVKTLGDPAIIQAVKQVRAGEYSFWPLGYDGTYGNLLLGEKRGWFGHCEVIAGSGQGRLNFGSSS
ncbi:MAG: hypothetical protein JXA52_01820, partial [Planctomycetes bacterium]|nr:hypothetical protein [Planctomycetota bacterium]